MSKVSRVILALIASIAIFALWVVFQMYVAKGFLVGILFCSAMIGSWKAIVHADNKTADGQSQEKTNEVKDKPQTEYNKDEK